MLTHDAINPPAIPIKPYTKTGNSAVLIITSAVLVVAGIRLILVSLWAGDAPYLDEWAMTGWLHIHAAEQKGILPWNWLTFPELEHRLVGQKLLSLSLAKINSGQWDVRVELCASALLWGGLAGGLVAIGKLVLSHRPLLFFTALVVIAEAVPHAWENLLWAFQSQFLIVIAGSMSAIYLLTTTPPCSLKWLLGIALSILAWSTQGAGLLAVPVAAIPTLIAMGREPKGRTLVNIASTAWLCGTTAILAYYSPSAPDHQWIHAGSFSVFFAAGLSLLSWPWSNQYYLSIVLWAPSVIYLFNWIRNRTPSAAENAFACLILWSLLLDLSSAWARGTVLAKDIPASRYTDVLVVGVLLNAALVLKWAASRRSIRHDVVTAAWLLLAIAGICNYAYTLTGRASRATSITALSRADFVISREPHASAIREYVRTSNSAVLDRTPPIYPVPEHLGMLIERLRINNRLSARLDPTKSATLPFLSEAANHAKLIGCILLSLGCIMGVASARRTAERPVST